MIEVTSEMIISGFVSKVVNDLGDILKNKIRDADKNRRSNGQTVETRIYQVIVDALNEFPYNEYKKDEKVYDAAESILMQFKSYENDYKEAVGVGLRIVVPQVTSSICEEFLEELCYEICMEENRDLAIRCIVYQGKRVIEGQKQIDKYMQKGFGLSHQNEVEIIRMLDILLEEMSRKKLQDTESEKRLVINRAEEYFKKWDKNVFLNDYNEEDENAGVNITLKEIYKEECLPHYIWKTNTKSSDELKNLLKKYIIDNDRKKILLILGQPGIGKSTLITWIMSNLVENQEEILVYQFANDLGSINWRSENILNDMFNIIGLEYNELENKTLILDGFDEIYVGGDRERILNKMDQELKRRNVLKNFSLIITCRQNYIYNLQNIECDYITLQVWNKTQIDIFCRAYWEVCESKISEDKIQEILKNKEIFGIPLILYMVLALNIDIETNSSIVDIYDQIFSLKKGSIYDRCYDVEHRINKPEIKEHIHRISQKIAFWMFENNADEAFISQEKFNEICESEMSDNDEEMQSNTLIGNFFKLKYCEGEGTDELQFVHRSIYEYFVAVYFYESIYKLTSKEAVAGKLGELLKDGHLSEQLLVFIKYKFDSIKRCNLASEAKEVFNVMLQDGMTYHIGTPCKNAIEREGNIFSNMLKVVSLWNPSLGALDKGIDIYLHCNRESKLNLRGADLRGAHLRGTYLSGADLRRAYLRKTDLRRVDLSGADLRRADLRGTDLRGADLIRADLRGANLDEADLRGADLREADLGGIYLIRANLRGANLKGVDLNEADLSAVIFDEGQVNLICKKYNLTDSYVYISETVEIISYKEYCMRKKGI